MTAVALRLFARSFSPLCFLPRCADRTSQRDVPIARRSPTQSRLLADEPDNMRGARWRCRGGIPQISWSALARRKGADPASHPCRRQAFWLIGKAIQKKLWSRRVRPLLAIRARVFHFSPEEIHKKKICQSKIRNREQRSGLMMARG